MKRSSPPDRILVLIPAYNAEPHVGNVIAGVKESGLPILVVDDGSRDKSSDVAEQAGVKVLRHQANRGKGAALQTGFAFASRHGYDAVLTIDADGQHNPAELPALLAAWRAQPQSLVLGVRSFDPKLMPRRSRIGNHISTFFISRFSHRRHSDTQTGFRIYPRRLFTLPLSTRRFDTETELLLWAAKLKVPLVEVPIQTIYHEASPDVGPKASPDVGQKAAPPAAGRAPASHFRNWEDTLRVIRLVVTSPWWRSPDPNKMEAH
jgi:glycosyltransferase involved in cell wall biosynthesis